eukprot:271388_1
METFEAIWLLILIFSTTLMGMLDYQTCSFTVIIIVLVQTILMISFFITHIILEGVSFILIGTYIIFPIHFILFINNSSSVTTICIMSFFLLIELCTIVLSILLPIPKIPNICGPFNIGTKLLCFDTEFYTKNNIQHNQNTNENQSKYKSFNKLFYIRMWYPIGANDINKHKNNRCYKIHPKDDKLKKRIFPNKTDVKDGYNYTLFLSKNCRVNSLLNTMPINDKQFPLLIYTHGQNSYPERNTYLIEELASNGFIICAPYHDDRSHTYPGPIKRRQIDIDFTIKYMMDVNNGKYYKEFKNTMDFINGVGLFGHSMGAMACVVRGATWKSSNEYEQLRQFYRSKYDELNGLHSVTRIIALDPWFEYLDIGNKLISVDIPMIICSSDGWRNYMEDNYKLNGYIQKKDSLIDMYEMKVFNSLHSNLTDFGIYHKYKFGKEILP